MWHERKKAWDIVPDMEEARARSMRHLVSLAASVVKSVLGPSPQQEKEEEAEEAYELRLRRFREAQEEMRSMSDEDYAHAVRNGFGDPPRREKPRSDDLDAWLRQKIKERLISKIDTVLLDLVGIESTYGSGLRLKNAGTALGKRLTEKAVAIAAELADKWLAENQQPIVEALGGEEIARHYKYELETATKKAVADRIALIAKERAEHIRVEVLEAAVDAAMFETYPVLRRMEAATRLGAKSESDAA